MTIEEKFEDMRGLKVTVSWAYATSRVISRGAIVIEDGMCRVQPGKGTYLKRPLVH